MLTQSSGLHEKLTGMLRNDSEQGVYSIEA